MTRASAALALLVAVAVGACGGDDDPLASLRAADAVQEVREDDGSGELVVTIVPRTGPFAIAEAVEALPEDVHSATFRLGRGELEVDPATREPRAAALGLVAVSRVRSPARRIAIQTVGSERRLRAEVERPEQAAPLARELAEQVGPDKLRADAIRTVQVDAEGGGTVVTLGLAGGEADLRTAAALHATDVLAARDPELSAGPARAELRVSARDVADAGAAWSEAADALDDAAIEEIDLYVDRDGTPILYGRADTSPRRALALLRELEAGGARGFARTDLGSVRVRIETSTTNRRAVAQAERAVRAARASGARRVVAEWRVADDIAWAGSVRPGDRDLTRIDDAPATVLRLLRGVRRAHEAGIRAIQWEHPPSADAAKLSVARLAEDEGFSRGAARAIRAIGWPGRATFEVRVGPGSGGGSCANANTVARLESTSDGRARQGKPYGCTDDALVDQALATWNATAAR